MSTKTILSCDFCGAVHRDGAERWFHLYADGEKTSKDVCVVCVERLRAPVSVTYAGTR